LIFNILTIFPDIFAPVETGVIGRALGNGLIEINKINIRDYAENKHNNTDDYPYGGGDGMLMTVQPVVSAWKSIENPGRTIIMSPRGKVFDQEKCRELASLGNITLVCGRYEGMDERITEMIADEELSIGDFVLSGGEIAAMTVIDAVSRLVPGVLGNENGSSRDSHFDGLLEYPQYTRPEKYEGYDVPPVLLSGNHAFINKYRKMESLVLTWKLRPDMIEKRGLDEQEIQMLSEAFPEDKKLFEGMKRLRRDNV
jgi:tRNA (guanine37-N1)-methyltransferase